MSESLQHRLDHRALPVPTELQPSHDKHLPAITAATIQELRRTGWTDIGIMVPIIDTDGRILMQQHNGRAKNRCNALGPLGETIKTPGGIPEQPLQALYRGLVEEQNISHPEDIPFHTIATGGWVINRWPKGLAYPGVINCAIVFPLYLDDYGKHQLLSLSRLPSKEIIDASFMSPSEIDGMPDTALRDGVKPWLHQAAQAGLLDPTPHELVELSTIGTVASR